MVASHFPTSPFLTPARHDFRLANDLGRGPGLLLQAEYPTFDGLHHTPDPETVQSPGASGELVDMATDLDQQGPVHEADWMAGEHAEPEFVVLANGERLVEYSASIKKLSRDKDGTGADDAAGERVAVDPAAVLTMDLLGVHPAAMPDPDLVGVDSQVARMGIQSPQLSLQLSRKPVVIAVQERDPG